MKLFLICLLILPLSALKAQNKITKYYDANWFETSKEKAAFYADFIKDGNNYHCTSYRVGSNSIRGISTFEDTVMQMPVGLQVLYFDNGHLGDSSFYEDHKVKYSFHYYPNGQLECHYYLPDNKKEGVAEGFDESGKRIKKYVFEKEAEFKGGEKAWLAYIKKNVSKDLNVKGKKEVTAKVVIQFIVDENGYVVMPKIHQSSGYRNVDADALRIISDSPDWKNAIQFNNPVKAFRLQPFTYILQPQQK
jgi:hypothetical protein